MRAFIGGVQLDIVESEQPQYTAEVTEKPVESGQAITDHVRKRPNNVIIVARLVGDDWESRKARLESAQDRALLLTYNGKTRLDNAVIESMFVANDRMIANGTRITITMRQVRIAEAREEITQAPDPVTPPTAAAVQATVSQTKEYTPAVKTYLQERFDIPSLGDIIEDVADSPPADQQLRFFVDTNGEFVDQLQQKEETNKNVFQRAVSWLFTRPSSRR